MSLAPNPTVSPSERLFNPQTVCVWASGVYVARWFNPNVPATVAEVLALAAASGVPSGASGNFGLLKLGMAARYGLVGQEFTSFNPAAAQLAVAQAAAAGPCAAILAGDQANLLPAWQPGNHVGHAIAVIYRAGTTGVQLDPLAPAGYAGDPFPLSELSKFATASLIFKTEALQMPGVKAAGPAIGRFSLSGAGHSLISPLNTAVRYPQAAGATFDVLAVVNLKTPTGVAVDIEGNSPPLSNRDQVYLVDAPNFGVAAYALRADGVFTPTLFDAAAVESAKAGAARAAAKAVAGAADEAAGKF